MSAHPWMKFYPRDWRGDQALRVVSLAARGLWMEMLCIMHEASPYGHLMVGNQPVEVGVLARLAGTSAEEVQALLVELQTARVFRRTRAGVIYSKRMTDDHKRSIVGRDKKLEGLEKAGKKPAPSRSPTRSPTTQKPEARAEVEGLNSPSTLCRAKKIFLGPKEVRDAFIAKFGEDWVGSYLDPCAWQDVPDRALVPATRTAASKLTREGRPLLASLGIIVLENAA